MGLRHCRGEIIVLSDDDCWYPENAACELETNFNECDVLLSQIYDPENKKNYKKYTKHEHNVNNRFELMSKSSIEIAFSKNIIEEIRFDESFGLGARYVCGEEVDLLLKAFAKGYKIKYIPEIMVYHPIKLKKTNITPQIIAKGALYAKHFNIMYGLCVCVRDLLLKKENNFINFMKGYYEYKK